MNFSCNLVLVGDLQGHAKDMEVKLKRWNEEVSKARKQFYELNYFTTRQLLVLRNELGVLKNSSQSRQWGQVMALLRSLSNTYISPFKLLKVISDVEKQYFPDESRILGTEQAERVRVVHPTGAMSLPALPPIDQLAQGAIVDATAKETQSQPSLPCSGLTEEQLSMEQKQHFTKMCDKLKYSKRTALKAIEANRDGDWNDIDNWLVENAAEYEAAFQKTQAEEVRKELESFDDEESDQSESDSEVEDNLPPEGTATAPGTI